MSNISGTNLAAGIAPFTTEDSYATHYAEYGKGGWHSVSTTTERDAIPSQRREEGMAVYVTSEKNLYILRNGSWEKYNIPKDDVDGLQSLLDSFKEELNTEMENHEATEKAYHNDVVRVVNEAKAYMDDCAKYNQAICGFDGNNGIALFDQTKTYNYGDLVAMKTDDKYTIYRCIVSSHTGAFSEADFMGTNMFQEYNRIYAGGANEMVTVVVTKDGTPIVGKEVILNNTTTGETQTTTTNDEGIAIFGNLQDEDKVPYGEIYTVTASAEEGCNIIPESTFVANTPARTVKLAFMSKYPDYGYEIPCITASAHERQQIELNNTIIEEALNGKVCTLIINNEVVETAAFVGRTAQFSHQIETGTAYSVVVPDLTESNLTISKNEISVVSLGVSARPIAATYYVLHPNAGVVGITSDGVIYDRTKLQAALDSCETEDEKKAIRDSIIYIGISNDATQPADEAGIDNHTGGLEASTPTVDGRLGHVYSTVPKNCSFMFHLRQISGVTFKGNVMWSNKNETLLTMPYVSNSAASFLKDMDGEGRTAQMNREDWSFPAKDFVTSESGNIQSPFNGEVTLKPFMPSSGQLYQVSILKNDVCYLYRLVMGYDMYGTEEHPFYSSEWWSASQSTAAHALYLRSGSMTSHGKTSGRCVARFYEFA